MSYISDLMGYGFGAEKAGALNTNTVNSAPTRSVATGLTAAGTVIADALQLTAFISNISTAAASTGVKLPANWPVGQIGFVYNGGANTVNLFPPTGTGTLNGGGAGAALTIAAAAANLIVRHSATDWGAYVLAKEN